MLPHSSWRIGALGSSAARASTTGSSGSYSTIDELGRVTGALARVGHDRGDRLADVARLADGQRVVLDVGRRAAAAIWKNGSVRIATSSPVSVPYTPGSSSAALTSIDEIVACGVRRAHEVEVAHALALDVVEEDALALDEPAVLRAGHALPERGALLQVPASVSIAVIARSPSPAATTASMMFQ